MYKRILKVNDCQNGHWELYLVFLVESQAIDFMAYDFMNLCDIELYCDGPDEYNEDLGDILRSIIDYLNDDYGAVEGREELLEKYEGYLKQFKEVEAYFEEGGRWDSYRQTWSRVIPEDWTEVR